ncbi:ATP-dependent RNA helicase RhlB [Fontimonas thermophila]|uniref:ATP-dependent RNA helicase RhlB n=1 Tax=Fontimonas thermophila TaxID=1076937 RepID=A0A1I2K9T3_9GAMM|nr:DEAD/DEAH box helicase [Fontimonas thermophila]SFF63069.1 ATP-dependent RNA helicase RhlB [Fontimonas thermophila]
MHPSHLSDLRFHDLELHPSLLAGLDALGYTHCTPIQAAALPRALRGEDLAGQAQTGTGKSAAFLLATMHWLLTHPRKPGDDPRQPRALVLAPTRELAVQIHKDAEALGAKTGLRMTVCYGGAGYETQRAAIESGVDLLIGTPGRLIDYYKQRTYTLSQIEVLVLDEADRMFDLGFIADIRYLIRKMPPPSARRNYLFSATLSHRVLELAYEHMNNPQRIAIEPEQVTADKIRQAMIHVANDEKLPLLVGLLRSRSTVRTLIFVNTKREAETVERGLRANGFEARVLSGDVSQGKRLRLLEEFKAGRLPVLVATDVAARGLHIPGVDLVVNYDLPQDPEDYVHRIGRTARAGASGDAISLCCETWVYSLPEIEKYIGMRIPPLEGGYNLIAQDYIAPRRESDRRHHGGSSDRIGRRGRGRR